MSSTKVGSQWL